MGLRLSNKALFSGTNPWRGSQVVRQGSAKALCVGSIPTSASKFIAFIYKGLVTEGSATDTKSDTSFPTPKELSETPGNSPATR
jgi:hypothetical protein